jgi:hypothetical protein
MRSAGLPATPIPITEVVCLGGAGVLVPWVAYLASSLPHTYVLANWNAAWVGFDIGLIVLLGATGLLVRRGHPHQVPAAYLSAAFLLADSWFDVMTSSGAGLLVALATAVFVELPLAGFLLRQASRASLNASSLQ